MTDWNWRSGKWRARNWRNSAQHNNINTTLLLLLFLLSSVLLLVNLHQEMHIKSSNSSISCDDKTGQLKYKTGQLKHRLWQTVTQFKAILRLLAGWRYYVSQHSVRPYWCSCAEHNYISHTSHIVHFIVYNLLSQFPICHFPVRQIVCHCPVLQFPVLRLRASFSSPANSSHPSWDTCFVSRHGFSFSYLGLDSVSTLVCLVLALSRVSMSRHHHVSWLCLDCSLFRCYDNIVRTRNVSECL